jgi:hypothetical protein
MGITRGWRLFFDNEVRAAAQSNLVATGLKPVNKFRVENKVC